METNITLNPEQTQRTRRIKKQKCIEDLGFEVRTKRPKIIYKKLKCLKLRSTKISKKTESLKNIFNEFKKCENFEKFSQFNKIEKRLRLNSYKNLQEMASDIRKVFDNIFLTFSGNPAQYNEAFRLSNYFEEIYRDHEDKLFTKKSKNILELKKKMNRLRKEIRETGYAPNNKLKININDYNLLNDREKKISKKYKLDLVNNIKSLNSEQIKGIIHIIRDSLNFDEKSLEFDVNKLPQDKLKELDRYVKKCLKSKQNFKEINNYNFYSNLNTVEKNLTLQNIGNNIAKNAPTENINVSININNNFVMGNFKTNSLMNNINFSNQKIGIENTKKNSILSDSDSLSSDEESGKLLKIFV